MIKKRKKNKGKNLNYLKIKKNVGKFRKKAQKLTGLLNDSKKTLNERQQRYCSYFAKSFSDKF